MRRGIAHDSPIAEIVLHRHRIRPHSAVHSRPSEPVNKRKRKDARVLGAISVNIAGLSIQHPILYILLYSTPLPNGSQKSWEGLPLLVVFPFTLTSPQLRRFRHKRPCFSTTQRRAPLKSGLLNRKRLFSRIKRDQDTIRQVSPTLDVVFRLCAMKLPSPSLPRASSKHWPQPFT